MNNKIVIDESDIFNFVLFPSSLSREKKEFIEGNLERFRHEIDFYKGFSKPLDDSNLVDLKDRIEKLESGQIKTYVLIPTWNPIQSQDNTLRLAAASATLDKKIDSVSFADEGSNYLIRVIKTTESTLLYLFQNVPSKKSFFIKLFPSETAYLIKDVSKPIEILDETEITKITVEELS
jgi:hypothetical protein